MDEENKEENKEEPAPDNSGKGIQQETISELDRADQIAERQKKENDRREELINREENLEARRRVGGVAEAGQTVETEDAKAKKLADEISGAFK